MKQCGRCKETKDYIHFSKFARRKDGYDCYCKECQKIWRTNNRDKLLKDKKNIGLKIEKL